MYDVCNSQMTQPNYNYNNKESKMWQHVNNWRIPGKGIGVFIIFFLKLFCSFDIQNKKLEKQR